jgi:hypothetical protein
MDDKLSEINCSITNNTKTGNSLWPIYHLNQPEISNGAELTRSVQKKETNAAQNFLLLKLFKPSMSQKEEWLYILYRWTGRPMPMHI